MSLINDALRKARQAASERDATQTDLPFRGERIHSSRRGRQSNGPVIVVLTAVAAGLLGAFIAWWGFGRQIPLETTQTAPRGAATSVEIDDPITNPSIQPTPNMQDEPAITLQPTVAVTQKHPPSSASSSPLPGPGIETDAEPVNAGGTQPQTDEAAEVPTVAAGDREFILEADLGYATLSLDFIVFRPTDPFAEINGTEVHEGSEVEGFTVEKIERDRVQLRDSRGPVVLKVP